MNKETRAARKDAFHNYFLPQLFPTIVIFCVPAALIALHYRQGAKITAVLLIIKVLISVLARLPKFVKAQDRNTLQFYRLRCLAKWTVYAVSLIIGTVATVVAGLF